MWTLLLACADPPPAVPSPEDFTEQMSERLTRRLTRHDVQPVQALRLKVISPDGFEHELDLSALHGACERQPTRCEDERVAWVERQGRNAQARAEPFRLGLLRPRLMRAEEAKLLDLPAQGWMGELVVVPSLDSPSSSRGVTQAELSAEELQLDEALKQAQANLEREASLQLQALDGASRVVYSPRAADLLLVDALWSEGQLVLAVQPQLLLTGQDPQRLLELAEELADSSQPRLSEAVLERTATGWSAR